MASWLKNLAKRIYGRFSGGGQSAGWPGGHRRPLSQKYTVALATLVCGALVTSGLAEAFFSYHETRRVVAELQRERATIAAQAIEHFVNDVEAQLRWASPPVRPEGSAGIQERREDYYRMLQRWPAVSEIHYLDAAGREQLQVSRLDLDRVGGGADYSATPDFRGATIDRPYFGPVYFVDETDPYMNASLREAAPAAGTTLVEVNLKLVRDVVCCTRVGDRGIVYVVDARGRLIAHPDVGLVQRRTNLAAPPAPLLAHVRRAVESPSPVSADPNMVLGWDPENRPVVSSYAAIGPTGWIVFVEQPLVEALQPLFATLLRTAALFVFGLALSVLVSLALARKMVAPVEALQRVAARIDAGALDQRIDVHTGDELEALADEFNHMAVRLRDSYANLEEQVDERTRNLAAALAELKVKSRQLEEASLHKSEFLASLTHEVRTPLTSIIGFAQLMPEARSGQQSERRNRFVQHILASAQHVLDLINETLEIARAESGKVELGISRFGLRAALEDAVAIIEGSANRRRVTLRLSVDPSLTDVEADERKIKQIVLNLLSNAIKVSRTGGLVEIQARRNQESVEIAVKDAGVGIAPEHLDRIFEAYEQLPDGSALGGSGLGLALSKHFAELHGGRITVESEVGVGSTFTLVLPVDQGATEAPAATVATRPQMPGDGHRPVLVIEDDATAAELVQDLLGPEGYTVIRAADAPQGLALARSEQPGLVIVDLVLPGADGFSVVHELRSDPATAGVPILVVTGKNLSQAEREWLQPHIDYLAQKGSFPPTDLAAAVRRLYPPAA